MNNNVDLNQSEIDNILLLLGVLLFFNSLGAGIAFPIIPLLGPVIGISPLFISIIILSNRFARVISNSIVGEIVDKHGCRKLLILGLFFKYIDT